MVGFWQCWSRELAGPAGVKRRRLSLDDLYTRGPHPDIRKARNEVWYTLHNNKQHLQCKRSMIPGAGRGLFSAIDIPNYTFIARYEGQIVRNLAEATRRSTNGNRYIFFLYDEHSDEEDKPFALAIDPAPKRYHDRLARYINAVGQCGDRRHNVEFYQWFNDDTAEWEMWAVTTRNIRAGEELLAWYGPDTERIICL
jgi:hypothetical protein